MLDIMLSVGMIAHVRQGTRWVRQAAMCNFELKDDSEEEAVPRKCPPIHYTHRHDWSLDNPGDHWFQNDHDFVEYLRYGFSKYYLHDIEIDM